MIKNFISAIKLPQLRGSTRLAIWCLLCISTALIFLYPAQLHYEYAIVQSFGVFSNLPLFSALYFIWFALILILLFFPNGEGNQHDWENVVLLGIFVLVFSGIWVELTHGYNGEFLYYASLAKSIVNTGRFPTINPIAGGNDYPGLSLVLSAVRLTTGLQTFNAIVPLLLINMLAYSTLLYVFLRNILKKPSFASFGTLILLSGTRDISQFFPELHARAFGIVLLIALIVLLFREQKAEKPTITTVVSVALFGALTITHLPDALVFTLIIVGVFLIGRFRKQNIVDPRFIILAFTIIFGWLLYVALNTSTSLIQTAQASILQVMGGEPISSYLLSMTGSYFGASGTSLLDNFVRFFWLFLTIGVGAIIGILKLLKIKRLSSIEGLIIGCLVGLGLFLILMVFASGLSEGYRDLFYVPMFAVAIMLSYVASKGNFLKRYGFAILVILLLLISVPTFFINNDRVGLNAASQQEIDNAQFLSSNYGDGQGIKVVGDGDEQYRLVAFEMSDVNYEGFLEFSNPLFADQNPMQQAWDQLQTLLIQFEKPTESGIRTSLFIYSSRLSSDFEFTFRVDPTKDPRWQQFQDNLNQNILIYNDGFNEVYSAGDVGS